MQKVPAAQDAAERAAVADFMIERVQALGRIDRTELTHLVRDRFGASWVNPDDTLNERLLSTFRRRQAGAIRYQSPHWEWVNR